MTPKKVKSPSRQELRTLIDSIGGAETLKRLLDRFYERMQTDTMVGYFFAGKNIHEIAEKQSQFMLLAAGLIQNPPIKGPATAHAELPPIYSGHFDRRLVLLREVLIEEGLSETHTQLWVSFEESFRAVVVSS
jgi:truncated hemoglobin YjbI